MAMLVMIFTLTFVGVVVTGDILVRSTKAAKCRNCRALRIDNTAPACRSCGYDMAVG